ncbi:hypothetical protein [Tissierella sp.]|uniref:hypothetical protein n=1 Tax=Tissierella sp. TaxID=41274 RepID=UPI002864FE63|nr:hypothetical protein [Tissierella sp.]MDR7856292.1 hypothetical protein [Tissierella sp.]
MTKVGIGGVWKDLDKAWVGIGGVWKEVEKMWVGIDGVWKEVEGLKTLRLFVNYNLTSNDGSMDKYISELNPSTLAKIRTSAMGITNNGVDITSLDKALYTLRANTATFIVINPETFTVIGSPKNIGGTPPFSSGSGINANDNYMYISYYSYVRGDEEYPDTYTIYIEKRNKITLAALTRVSIDIGGYSDPELVGGSDSELYGGNSRSSSRDVLYEKNPETLADIRQSTANPLFTEKMQLTSMDSFNTSLYVASMKFDNIAFKSYIAEFNKTNFVRLKQTQLSSMEKVYGLTMLK